MRDFDDSIRSPSCNMSFSEAELDRAVANERERCAKLIEMLAGIHDANTQRLGVSAGSFEVALRTVAMCIRNNYDPDSDKREREDKKIAIMTEDQKIEFMQQIEQRIKFLYGD